MGTVGVRRSPISLVTLNFFGLDGDGRIVSRGFTRVSGPFDWDPRPFAVDLRPDGREVRFELRVAMIQAGGARAR